MKAIRDDQFVALVTYDPKGLRGKHAMSAQSEALMHIDSALSDSNVPGSPHVNAVGLDGEEVHALIVLSTAHITQETAEALHCDGFDFTVWANEYGFIISTRRFNPNDPTFDPPQDLKAVIDYARQRGASYLMLDRDASTVDRLPTFDW